MCECYQVGGPFIAEDPDCPIHGTASQGREEQVLHICQLLSSGEISPEFASDWIMSLFNFG